VIEFNKNHLGLTVVPTSQRHSGMEMESVSAVLRDSGPDFLKKNMTLL
jgi:hypothetical protein